jgi:hypothetical protein
MTIEERLEKMEKELRRQKQHNRWLLGIILAVVGGLVVPVLFKTTPMQAQTQVSRADKEIRAKSIFLEDEIGKIRATLAVGKTGPALELYDENGKPRVIISLQKDGSPSLALFDKNRQPRAILIMLKDGTPSLKMYDENGKPRTELSMYK